MNKTTSNIPAARRDVDVVVLGAGTAGLHAARALAEAGFDVAVLERRTADRGSGARWCNAVLPAHFELARLPLPEEPEARIKGGASHLISPSGKHRVIIDHIPAWECDMRLLVDRLGRDATSFGARLYFGVEALELELRGERPVACTFRAQGEAVSLRAKLFVDASGLKGILRSQITSLRRHCPPIGPEDLCSAHQQIFTIADRAGAQRFLDAHGAREGDAITELGLEGGYSTRVIRVERSLEEVSVLTGTIPHGGHKSGAQLLRDFKDREPWVGEPVFGGGAAIPLRRVYHRLTAPGVALVGDAACQVMAGHGSGIGFGLIAGRVLADAMRGASDPGDPRALFRYQSRFLREHGAVFAGYDAVRRMSVRLGSRGIERMFETGLFSAPLAEPGLHQELGTPSLEDALAQLATLARHRDLREAVAPTLGVMAISRVIYRAYPRELNGRAIARWRLAADRLLAKQAAA
jgi:flavin-dependent dehydrogenase